MKVPKTMLAFFVLFLIFCMNMCAEVKKSSGESNNGPWVTYSKSVPEKEEITCTMFTNSGKVTCFKQEKVGGWWISYYEDFDDVAVGAVGKILFDKLAQEYKAQEAEKKKKEEGQKKEAAAKAGTSVVPLEALKVISTLICS